MTAPAIETFWSWWSEGGRVRCTDAVESGDWTDLSTELNDLLAAIDPDLEWEFGSGQLSEHALCLSAGGNAALRPTAERWLLAAPAADDEWEYRSARAPDPSMFEPAGSFTIGDTEIAPGELRVVAFLDDERQVLDVELWHPQLDQVDGELRQTAMFLMIDWLLGEDAVERWIGTIDFATEAPTDGLTPETFATAVETLERENLEPTYALLSGAIAGRPVMIMSRRPLKRVEFPLFDLRLDARVFVNDVTEDGLPVAGRLETLDALEEDLAVRLGDRGVIAAVVTRDGVRTFLVYCDQEGGAPAIVEGWIRAHPDETVILSFEIDPAWEAVADFC